MISNLIWLAVGAFVGWNVPQPQWAKDVKGWLWEEFTGLFKKK